MYKARIYFHTLFVLILLSFFSFSIGSASGHGLGLDTISSIDVDGKKISISVEMPTYFTESANQITITATEEGKQNVNNVTFLIGLFHDDEMIFKNHFFAPDGRLVLNVNPTEEGKIQIIGEQDSLLGAFYTTAAQPIELTGPVFESGGLFHFEIEIRTIDEPTNIIEDLGVYSADVSVISTTSYIEKDQLDQDVNFIIKSYFNKISNFEYDPIQKTVTFELPFDWSEKTISHIPLVHEEVHFPKNFDEFLSPSYVGTVNGVDLFKSSVTVDDYTEDDERIVHLMLLSDHLKFLKNEQKKSGMELPDNLVFTLTASSKVVFPIIAMTKNEEIQVDLSWEPTNIEPDINTIFIFTIRDGATGNTLRNSSYDFVIIQSGQEVYRASGKAVVGGSFETFTFSEKQTGPTIIRFENIRGTDMETEFGIVVVPEFGTIATMILAVTLTSLIILIKKNSILSK